MSKLSPPGYYPHISYGTIVYDLRKNDPKLFEPWWGFIMVDQGIVDFYSWLSYKWGKPLDRSTAWGAHVSWVKGEEPKNKSIWGKRKQIRFRYSNTIRYDNQLHAWLDVWCPQLHALRAELGLPQKRHWNFHITLGRIR
jgi:hypothetical protein